MVSNLANWLRYKIDKLLLLLVAVVLLDGQVSEERLPRLRLYRRVDVCDALALPGRGRNRVSTAAVTARAALSG